MPRRVGQTPQIERRNRTKKSQKTLLNLVFLNFPWICLPLVIHCSTNQMQIKYNEKNVITQDHPREDGPFHIRSYWYFYILAIANESQNPCCSWNFITTPWWEMPPSLLFLPLKEMISVPCLVLTRFKTCGCRLRAPFALFFDVTCTR